MAKMNRTNCALLIVFLILVFPVLLFANGNGNVTITINGHLPGDPAPLVAGCDFNRFEIWIQNDAPLYQISIAFSLDGEDLTYNFRTPYGSLPAGSPYVREHGTAIGAFDLGGLIVNTSKFPDTLVLTGNASSNPLPIHIIPTLCYSLQLDVAAQFMTHYFWIDNITVPPDGVWMFNDGSEYAPNFWGYPNTGINNPDAPAMRFEASVRPCIPPHFLTTPAVVESRNHCSNFTYTFQAENTECDGSYDFRFFSSVGIVNETSGEFELAPIAGCAPTEVTVWVVDNLCLQKSSTFTVNWINTPVTLTNRPTSTGQIGPNDVYEYPFGATDPDECDTVICTALPVGNPPAGAFDVGSDGEFSFTPTSADSGHTYTFDLIATSGCSSHDSCRFSVKVGNPLCGDANGDEGVNISDAVHLISYIFSGGLPPNPLQNGDVDCNAAVNISDAVYLISYIFAGGYLPCAGCP
jgi:hypothetical protein